MSRNGRRTNKLTEPIADKGGVQLDYDDCMRLFLRACKIRNLSEHTVESYGHELRLFRNTLEKQNVDTRPTHITKKIIENNIILHMMEAGAKETTINTRLRTVRAFFNWLVKEGVITRSPMEAVPLIKAKRKVVETFTRDQIRLLLGQPDRSTFTGLRDYTIMLFLLETGVRARELCDISIDDIRWADSVVRIDGKGYKERLVPVQTTVKRQLSRYIGVRGDLETDTLFVNIDNKPLSKRRVQELISDYGKRANLTNVRCSPHTFRHTFAKMSVQNGADVFALQAILGHATLEMVRTYVNLFSTDVYEKHRKFSPVEKLF